MPYLPKTPTDPLKLRAIVDLRRAGWSPEEITVAFGISKSTLKRRFAEIRRLQATKVHA